MTRPRNERLMDAASIAGLTLLIGAAYASFYGKYAFDDSYVGYSNAENLLQGHGMTFDPGSRLLTTSAPLAVPLYALVARLAHASVIDAAQLLSAIALLTIALGAYVLARRFAAPFGAFLGAAALISSPFVLLLWSHESLLAAAALTIAMLFFSTGRWTGCAVALGAASLLRAETLVVLPFLCAARYRAAGRLATLAFALLSVAPLFAWTIFATVHFGSPASTTLSSKHAQFFYYDITPYLYGAYDFVARILAPDGSPALPALLLLSVALAWSCLLLSDPDRRRHLALGAWCAATTLVYVVLELPFYFWFGLQWAVAAGYAAAASFPAAAATRNRTALRYAGKAAAVLIAAANVQFLVAQLLMPALKTTYYDWVIMPNVRDNNYRTLGTWFASHTNPGSTLTYPEFGQVHFYSHRAIVDYLGIATAGAAAHLRAGDAIWTFKRYRPTYYVDDRTWWYFSNPLEFDWFRDAYAPVAQLHLGGDTRRSDFSIYRLEKPAAVPNADDADPDATIAKVDQLPDGYAFDFSPSQDGMDGVGLRLFFRSACPRVTALIYEGKQLVAMRSEAIPQARAITRVSVSFDPLPSSSKRTYTFAVHACGAAVLAPPVKLRSGFIVFGKPSGEFGGGTAALTVYRRSPE